MSQRSQPLVSVRWPAHSPRWLGQQVSPDASSDGRRGGLDRIPGEMGVARGRLHLRMSQELTDHCQAFAEGQGTGREGVA